ncbi:MAG: hypothetical protein LLG00_06360, partial [Planctomycetaceae bacterium]|nr:hypothetical protein [Planctomycetaceae bacterium]
GKELGRFDLHGPNAAVTSHRLGVRTLGDGRHTLRLECVGKSPDSKSYFLGFDSLIAHIPVYSRNPSVDLRTLQKK